MSATLSAPALSPPDAPVPSSSSASTDAALSVPPDRATFRSVVPPRRRSRRRAIEVLAAVIAAAAAVATLAFDRTPLILIGLLFFLVVPFEMLFPRHGRKLRRPGLGTDIAYGLVSTPLGVIFTFVAAAVGVLSLAWLPGLALKPLVGLLPGPVATVLGIALFDMIVYWGHRWGHEVPFLWRFHAIHHSTRRLDWVSGVRNHPFDGVFIAPAFVLLIAAGFSAEFTGVLAAVQFVVGLFAHANVRWRLRPLRTIVFTPEFHHWHHADEPEAINTNYSVFLPLWDIVFGTYYMPADKRPQQYGVAEPIPDGIVSQLIHPLRGLRTPWQIVRHPLRAVADTARAVRRGMRQVWASVRRTRRSVAAADGSYTA